MTFRVTTAIMAAAALTGSALAQVWVPPSGGNSFFSYFGGHNSNTNLFGTPTLVGNSFVFSPSNFTAQSIGGLAAGATDQINVQIVAAAGQHVAGVMVQEFGSWGLTGAGSLQDTGSLFIQDLSNPRAPAIGSMSYNVVSAGGPVPPTMPIVTPGGGTWSGLVYIDLDAILGPQWTNIELVFTNTLQASTVGAGSVGTITKNASNGIIVTPFFPAPGSGALLAAGCVAIFRRRRR